MIVTTTRRLRAYLGGAVTANQPTYNVSWVDIDGTNYVTTPDSNGGALNNTSPVEIVPVAASGYKRQVRQITIHNRDTVAVLVTVEYYNGTTQSKLYQALLATNWTLEWEPGGTWHVYDADGILQGTGGGGTGTITVEEVDGNPSLTGITKIQFDQGDGFVVSQPVAGTARIDVTATPAPDESARLLVFMSLFNRGL